MLQNFCCNKAQGYYYAKPMKAQDYMELLRNETDRESMKKEDATESPL